MIEEIKIDGLLKEEIAEIDKKLELVLENETGCNTEDSKVFKDETEAEVDSWYDNFYAGAELMDEPGPGISGYEIEKI